MPFCQSSKHNSWLFPSCYGNRSMLSSHFCFEGAWITNKWGATWNSYNRRIWLFSEICVMLLLCSHSPNDVPTEPQRNISIAAVRGAVHPSKICVNFLFKVVIHWSKQGTTALYITPAVYESTDSSLSHNDEGNEHFVCLCLNKFLLTWLDLTFIPRDIIL